MKLAKITVMAFIGLFLLAGLASQAKAETYREKFLREEQERIEQQQKQQQKDFDKQFNRASGGSDRGSSGGNSSSSSTVDECTACQKACNKVHMDALTTTCRGKAYEACEEKVNRVWNNCHKDCTNNHGCPKGASKAE